LGRGHGLLADSEAFAEAVDFWNGGATVSFGCEEEKTGGSARWLK
jgi:hypothetical protein